MTTTPGTLYLIPSFLSETALASSLSAEIVEVLCRVKVFLVENEKSARHFIRRAAPEIPLQSLALHQLSEHTDPKAIPDLLAPLGSGEDVGVISEAGCPGIADPGSHAVAYAHTIHAVVHPLVGPCSITLALMASGLSGQRWRFLGYPPRDGTQRDEFLKDAAERARSLHETQIVMDAPYRNEKLLTDLVRVLTPHLLLCVATDVTGENERIVTASAASWRARTEMVPKSPTLFLFGPK